MIKVTIENDRGRLRLRWQFLGERYQLSTGLNNNATGRGVARMKAGQIETDIAAGYFDLSLLKYKPRTLGQGATELTVCEYTAILSHLKQFFGDASVKSVEGRRTGDFVRPVGSGLRASITFPQKVTLGLSALAR
jgi:hypothetical protein